VLAKSLILLIRFLLELAMLAALGYWGFKTGDSAVMQWLLGLGTPALAAVLWGLYIAPKATHKVPKAVWIGLQVVLFGAAAGALAAVAPQSLAVVFAVAVVVDGAAVLAIGD
jgi:hypothetical protein